MLLGPYEYRIIIPYWLIYVLKIYYVIETLFMFNNTFYFKVCFILC